jgi:hypothetical protein
MDTHVKVLGSLQIALGAMTLFGALVLVFVFGGVTSVISASGDPDTLEAVSILGITGMALITCLMVLGLPSVIIGIGLIRLRPWARVAGMVISILSLMMIPFGTIVGVYGLWVLFSKDTERIFSAASVG